MKKNLFRLLLCFLVIACSDDDDSQGEIIVGGPTGIDGNDGGEVIVNDPFIYTPTASLKSVASYPVGMIASAQKLTNNSQTNQDFRAALNNDFNSITAENDMKMANMFSGPDTYDWSDGDAIVAYAAENGMRVHGHALIWHESIPGWLQSFDGTDEEFQAQIEGYVKATVAHFAEAKMTVDGEEVSVVSGWDVVNEAIDGAGLRSSLFSQRMGPNYMRLAFAWAREADADVKLFYNDYNIAGQASKRNGILNLVVKDLQDNDIAIDGVGLQMHIQYNFPSSGEITNALNDIAATGLLVHISELDIKANPDNDISELTEERAALQEDKFKEVTEQFKALPDAQKYGITVWGLRDSESWISDGGTEWPLLFDDNFNFKISHRGFAAGL